GLSDRAGNGVARGAVHRRGQHRRGRRLRLPRSPGALLVSPRGVVTGRRGAAARPAGAVDAPQATPAPPGGAAPSAGEPLLRVEELRVEFPTEDGVVHAVDGITFEVHRGRTLGIVGESGSGKTVTALSTLGLTRAQGARVGGRILFAGRDLVGLSERA